MKYLIIPAILAMMATTASASDSASAKDLDVTIAGVENMKGAVSITLYNEATYEGGAPLREIKIKADAETIRGQFEDLPNGTYGLKIYHDVNENGQIDTNPFGMPVEPFAFSNNARGRFGPATWEKAAFTVDSDTAEHMISFKAGS